MEKKQCCRTGRLSIYEKFLFNLVTYLVSKRVIANKETQEEKNPELLIIKYFSPIKLSFLNVLLFPQPKVGYISEKMQICMMALCHSNW